MTSASGVVTTARLPIPSGTHTARFAVFSESKPIAAAKTTIRVPNSSESLSVPNLIVSGGANSVAADALGDFILGNIEVQPRADATFLQSESLWYFFEVVNPSDPGKARIELRLRRGTEWVGSTRIVQADLNKIGENRYVGGYEMPLGTLDPGDYSLYVTIKDAAAEVVKRADFRILAR